MVLTRSFYNRPTIEVARDLLGKILSHREKTGETSGRIIEVEAYLGLGDLAAHSAKGLTPRTRPIFGPPGHAYVYFIYGMHECLNVVAEPDGTPGCVLIRALEPLTGLDLMRTRRGRPDLTSGPAKLTQALAITRAHNHADLTRGPLCILDAGTVGRIEVTRRIGFTQSADLPLRFLLHQF